MAKGIVVQVHIGEKSFDVAPAYDLENMINAEAYALGNALAALLIKERDKK